MRISLRKAGLLGVLLLPAGCAPNYVSAGYEYDRYGPVVEVYPYSSGVYGDWRRYYRSWQPVTVYQFRGRYYSRNVRGAQRVQVYRNRNGYFFPPRDRDWARTDRRFKDQRPNDRDRDRGGSGRPRRP